MKRISRLKLLKAAMMLMGTIGFWGFLYPELSMTQNVRIKSKIVEYVYYWKENPRAVREDREKQQVIEVMDIYERKCTYRRV